MARLSVLILVLSHASVCSASGQATKDVRDIVGVTHVAGLYHLTDKDFLNEGADQILALGSRVIKVWFCFGNRNVYLGEFGMPENVYPLDKVRLAIPNAVRTALDWGCPYIVYWELYCNELKDPKAKPRRTCETSWV